MKLFNTALLGASSAAPSPLLTDLVAYWKLADVSDSHTNGLTLTNNNSLTFGTGKVGNCANNFAAASSRYFSRASSADLVLGNIDWTIACWFNSSTFAASQGLVSKHNATACEYTLQINTSGNVVMQFGSTSATSGAVSSANWHLAVGWHDAAGDTINVQVDGGTPVSAATSGAAPPTNTVEFRIGSIAYVGVPFYMNGSIDEAAIWRRVLTAGERTQLYNGGSGVTYPTFA